MQELFAIAVFVVVLVLIVFDVVNRAAAALVGAVVMVSFGVVGQSRAAAEFIDWNTIGLLAGMMIIVAILERTGVFEYLAIRSAQLGRAKPARIMVILALVVLILSPFLDNVTTVILMVPITILIADALEMSPIPFLLAQIFIANIGGATTLIADPPNLIIGSAADLSFMDFVYNTAPAALMSVPPVLIFLYFVFRSQFNQSEGAEEAINQMDANAAIRDPKLLRRSLFVLGIVIVGFILHGTLHLEAATIALFGAVALMIYGRVDVEETLRRIEWPTLFFFIGLFVMVGGLQTTGTVDRIAELLTQVGDGGSGTTAVVIMWGGALSAAVIDNIPFTATMVPVLEDYIQSEGLSEAEARPLWWSLTFGADFSGNLTLIAASANVVVAGMSERAGHKIPFLTFMYYGIPVTLISLVVATPYVLLRYYS